MKNLDVNEYKVTEENGKTYLHLTKELNDTLLTNKELGDLMIELIEQNNVQKIIID